MNRRQLLAGAALAGWALTGTARQLAGGFPAANRCIAVHDGRYQDARQFAAALVTQGARPLDTNSDPDTWILSLLAGMQAGVVLCGMTPASDLALVRGCTIQPRLRLLHEALHDCRGASTITHSLRGAMAGPLARGLRHAPSDWPAWLAQQLVAIDLRRGTSAQARLMTDRTPASGHPGSLTSWMLG